MGVQQLGENLSKRTRYGGDRFYKLGITDREPWFSNECAQDPRGLVSTDLRALLPESRFGSGVEPGDHARRTTAPKPSPAVLGPGCPSNGKLL